MHYLKYKDILVPVVNGLKPRFQGQVRGILRDAMGNVVQDTGWGPNLITDQGLIDVRFNSVWSYWQIGSSDQAPAFTDVALVSPFQTAYKNMHPLANPFSSTNLGAPDYAVEQTMVIRFDSGTAGTIRECGCGFNGADLAMRTLVPTPVVKGIDNVFDLTYRMTTYPDLTDRTDTVTIEAETYNVLVRAQGVDATNAPRGVFNGFAQSTFSNGNVSDYSLGATPADDPTGGTDSDSTDYYDIIGSGSGYETVQVRVGLNSGNFPSGASLITLVNPGQTGQIGVQYRRASDNAFLPKDETKVLILQFNNTWGRH